MKLQIFRRAGGCRSVAAGDCRFGFGHHRQHHTGGVASTLNFHAVNEGGHVQIASNIADIECDVTLEGKIEGHDTGVTAKVNLSTLT